MALFPPLKLVDFFMFRTTGRGIRDSPLIIINRRILVDYVLHQVSRGSSESFELFVVSYSFHYFPLSYSRTRFFDNIRIPQGGFLLLLLLLPERSSFTRHLSRFVKVSTPLKMMGVDLNLCKSWSYLVIEHFIKIDRQGHG